MFIIPIIQFIFSVIKYIDDLIVDTIKLLKIKTASLKEEYNYHWSF